MKASLPKTISSAIATMHWSLSPNANPMYYESLPALVEIRQHKNKVMADILENVHETIDNLVSNNPQGSSSDTSTTTSSNSILGAGGRSEERKQYLSISLALICLGNNLGDEAHALVTPLSWGEETYFGGQSFTSNATNDVKSLASYVHALVHRREGFAMGEFGMLGYQNANYWSSATHSYQNVNLPFGDIREQVLLLANEFGDEAMAWCKEYVLQERNNDEESYWESRALHELCARVSRDETSNGTKMKLFAEKVAEAELKILLQYSLNRAGYEINTMTKNIDDQIILAHKETAILPIVDETVAQSIANKVSSAHLGAFQSNDAVIMRNLFKNADDNHRFSVAAGLACRLLGSPACLCIDSLSQSSISPNENDGFFNSSIQIIIPNDETEVQSHNMEASSGISVSAFAGGELSVGDAFASKICLEDIDGNIQKRKKDVYIFLPRNGMEHELITFRDKFHGSRGETPTTVLQWSKGTIFKTDSL